MDFDFLKKDCMKRIRSVVNHHSGNHNECNIEDCLFLQIKNEEEGFNQVRFEPKNVEDLISLIKARYSEISRFKGKSMDLSIAGQSVLIEIITARLGEVNIDTVGKILSSNVCENYFSVLTKYSHGKRLNGNFTDTWRVQQAVVAGMIGNHKFVLEAMETLGVEQNEIRKRSSGKLIKRKLYQKKYHASDKQQKRRRLSDQVRAHALGKIENSKNRHQPDKVKPGENVASARKAASKLAGKKTKARKQKTTKCGNCNQIGHNKTECQEPIMTTKTKTRSKTSSLIRHLF